MLTNEFLSIAQMTIPETFEECLTYEMQILYLKRYIDEIAEGGIPSADLTDIWEAIHTLEDEVEKVDPDKIEQEIQAINESIQSLKDDKQDTLTFDTTPTLGSQNPVTSDGIRKAIDAGGGGGGGSTVSVDVGETLTGEPGTNAEVENTGTAQNVVLKFTIPRGEKGEKGEQGDRGEPGATGAKGDPGEPGERGPAGERGPEGPEGPQGAEGPQGERGPAGENGEPGAKGDPGESATVTVGETVTGEPGTPAKVENTGTAQNVVLKFTIPKGEKGDPGTGGGGGGSTVSVNVGETVTGDPGTDASVENTGDDQNVVLKFTIPRGDKGEQGERGPEGPRGEQGLPGEKGAKGDPGNPGAQGERGPEGPQGAEGPQGERGPAGERGEQGPAGQKGDPGESATVTVGETVTGEPGTPAKVENTGTPQNAILKFTIPKGEKGDPGTGGGGGGVKFTISGQNVHINGIVLRIYDATAENYKDSYMESGEGMIQSVRTYYTPTTELGVTFPFMLQLIMNVPDPAGTDDIAQFSNFLLPGMAEWISETEISFISSGSVAFGYVYGVETRRAVAQIGNVIATLTVTKEV